MTEEMGIQTFPKHSQCREVATGKARSPTVERWEHRTTSDDVDAEWRCWRVSTSDEWWV